MNIKKYLPAFVGLVLIGILGFWRVLLAADVSVPQDVVINLSGLGSSFTLMSTSDALDQVEVNDAGTAFTITTDLSTGVVNIFSADGYDMGGSHNSSSLTLSSCGPNGSTLAIRANITSHVTVTVAPSASAICSGKGVAPVSSGVGGSAPSGGGGGAGGSSGGSSSTSLTSTSVSSKRDPITGLTFSDINPNGSTRINTTNTRRLYDAIKLMVDNRTFKLPRKFYPNYRATRDLAIRIALGAVAKKSCGGAISTTSCKRAAINNNIIDAAHLPKNMIRRWEYLEMLLKAANVQLIPESEVAANLCRGVKANASYARVMATAYKYGVAQLFGESCRPMQTLKRWEAIAYAAKMLEALHR